MTHHKFFYQIEIICNYDCSYYNEFYHKFKLETLLEINYDITIDFLTYKSFIKFLEKPKILSMEKTREYN